ncbi:hypothetical protein ACJX0J_005649, partial [Zea mays]
GTVDYGTSDFADVHGLKDGRFEGLGNKEMDKKMTGIFMSQPLSQYSVGIYMLYTTLDIFSLKWYHNFLTTAKKRQDFLGLGDLVVHPMLDWKLSVEFTRNKITQEITSPLCFRLADRSDTLWGFPKERAYLCIFLQAPTGNGLTGYLEEILDGKAVSMLISNYMSPCLSFGQPDIFPIDFLPYVLVIQFDVSMTETPAVVCVASLVYYSHQENWRFSHHITLSYTHVHSLEVHIFEQIVIGRE